MAKIVDNVLVGQKLESLIVEANKTIEELGVAVNINPKIVKKKLKGKCPFSFSELEKISVFFDIPIEELLERILDTKDIESLYHKIATNKVSLITTTENTYAEKDIYGKTLIEYVIEENNIEVFKELVNNKTPLVFHYDEKAKLILLKTIKYMLEHKINDPIDYIIEYCQINKTFDSSLDIINEIFQLINNDNVLLQKLFIEEFIINEKAIIKKKRLLVSNDTWIRIISLNRLDNTLNFYIKNLELAGNIKRLIISFSNHNYTEGLYILLEHLEQGIVDIIKDDPDVLKAILKTECSDLISRYIDKGLNESIDLLLTISIKYQSYELSKFLIDNYPIFDLRLIGICTATHNRTDILELFVLNLNQDMLDNILGETPTQNIEMLMYLTKHKAQFKNCYLSSESADKANIIINELLGGNENE